MVIKMSKSLTEMFKETQATSFNEGAKTRETVARGLVRVNETTFNEGAKTRETVARGLARVNSNTNTRAQEIMDRSDANHRETRNHSDANHRETQRAIREEGARTRSELLDYMEWPEIVIGLILGIIAGISMWFAEKTVILKPVQWDTAGNVLKYGPDTFLVIVLAVLFGAFVFFCVSWIVHAIRRRLR